MPQSPYLVSGKVYTSRGTVPNSLVTINADISVLTDSTGSYAIDLANLQDGYIDGGAYAITAKDEFDNEFLSSSFTVSGGSLSKDLYLDSRNRNNEQTRNSETRRQSIRTVGDKPVSESNLLPVKTLEKPMTQQLAYNGVLVEYIGEASPGTPTDQAKWRIKKLTYSGNNVTGTVWASGNAEFNKVWTSRATYNYS